MDLKFIGTFLLGGATASLLVFAPVFLIR